MQDNYSQNICCFLASAHRLPDGSEYLAEDLCIGLWRSSSEQQELEFNRITKVHSPFKNVKCKMKK